MTGGFWPVVDTTGLSPLQCSGCGATVGYTRRDTPVYCSLLCAEDYPARSNEDRDALIFEIAVTEKTGYQYLAEEFGISRQRIQQVVAQRRVV